MNVGVLILSILLLALAALALARRDGTLLAGMERTLAQFARLVPRMLCALLAAGFVAKLIPSELIAGYLGEEAGLIHQNMILQTLSQGLRGGGGQGGVGIGITGGFAPSGGFTPSSGAGTGGGSAGLPVTSGPAR